MAEKLDALVDALTATAEVMGQQVTGQAIAIMAEDLEPYPLEAALSALTRVRRECHRFTLAAVVERMPNARPGPEEAWAMFPKDESETGVVTTEALGAWGVACGLWYAGDKIGARMAFKEAYERACSESPSPVPQWQVSLGWDKEKRRTPIVDAVDKGRLPSSAIQTYLPAPEGDDTGPIVALLTGKVAPKTDDPQMRARLARVREAIGTEQKPQEPAPDYDDLVSDEGEREAEERMRKFKPDEDDEP